MKGRPRQGATRESIEVAWIENPARDHSELHVSYEGWTVVVDANTLWQPNETRLARHRQELKAEVQRAIRFREHHSFVYSTLLNLFLHPEKCPSARIIRRPISTYRRGLHAVFKQKRERWA